MVIFKKIDNSLIFDINPLHFKLLMVIKLLDQHNKRPYTYISLSHLTGQNRNQVNYGLKKLRELGLIYQKRTRWGIFVFPLIKMAEDKLFLMDFEQDSEENYSYKDQGYNNNIRGRILKFSRLETDEARINLQKMGYSNITLELMANYLEGKVKK